jgi:hypothetical protein
LLQLFARQVDAAPDAVAVEDEDTGCTFTYSQLDMCARLTARTVEHQLAEAAATATATAAAAATASDVKLKKAAPKVSVEEQRGGLFECSPSNHPLAWRPH